MAYQYRHKRDNLYPVGHLPLLSPEYKYESCEVSEHQNRALINAFLICDRHSSRVEAKNPALLSNRDGYLLELTGWTQGSQAS